MVCIQISNEGSKFLTFLESTFGTLALAIVKDEKRNALEV